MPRQRLTEKAVRSLRPTPGKQVKYWDTGCSGLVLDVSYAGTKTWKVVHYRAGKPQFIKLGRFPDLDLASAREKAKVFIADPQKALAGTASGSFKDIAENWLKRYVVEKKKLRSAPKIRRALEKYVYPRWGEHKIGELRRRDMAGLLDHIEDKHGARQADLVLAYIRKLFIWYAERDDDFVLPIVRGMSRYDANAAKRKRILSADELRLVWKAAEKVGTFGMLVRFALLTAQRSGKIATMRWSDLDEGGVWHIPTEAREKGNAVMLTLPAMALAIIEPRRGLTSNPYVFPADRGDGPFVNFGQRKAELDAAVAALNKGISLDRWTVHDLRRTARSLMSAAKIQSEHAERVLGHAIRGVEGVYNVYDYAPEKAEALNKLANQLTHILGPTEVSNVISLKTQVAS